MFTILVAVADSITNSKHFSHPGTEGCSLPNREVRFGGALCEVLPLWSSRERSSASTLSLLLLQLFGTAF